LSVVIATMVFLLVGSGIFLMLRKHIFEVLLGVLLLSHGVNMLLISMGGWEASEKPPILNINEEMPVEVYADPLPQALILTAIVIGFGVAAFLIVLVGRGIEESGSPHVGELGREEGEA
jgi:multicomponent Na+:H+ antiporter subunit C